MALAQKQIGRPVEQKKDPDMNPCSYAHLIFEKAPKAYDGEKTASSTNVAGKTGYLHAEN
jgi:hypothetical protein